MTTIWSVTAASLVLIPAAALAQQAPELPPCENCADSMTIMSWGGAYQQSQQKAYTEPYSAATGIDVTWD